MKEISIKKLGFSLIVVLVLAIIFSGLGAAYNPPTGVLDPEEVDFGGKTVTYLFGGDETRYEEGGEAEGRLEEAEELFNVEVVFEEGPTYAERIDYLRSRIMGGEAQNDILYMSYLRFPTLAVEQLVRPLEAYHAQEYYENYITPLERSVLENFKYEDKYYAMGTGKKIDLSLGVILYNRDLIQREGLTDPQELYEEDEWTWDKMVEIAKDATRDLTGDGEIDQWGISLNYWNFIFGGLLYSNDAEPVRIVDGKYKFAMDEEPMLETLELIPRLLEENVVTSWSWGSQLAAGEVAMAPARLMRAAMISGDMDDEYGIVPLPRGPKADENLFASGGGMAALLPITVEEPDKLVSLHHFLYRPEDQQFDKIVEEHARTRKDAQLLMKIFEDEKLHEKRKAVFGKTGPVIRDLVQDTIGSIFAGDVSPTVGIEEISGEAQTRLDDVFND